MNRLTLWIHHKLEFIVGFITSGYTGVKVATTDPSLDISEVVIKSLIAAIITGSIGTLFGWIVKVTVIKYFKRRFKIEE